MRFMPTKRSLTGAFARATALAVVFVAGFIEAHAGPAPKVVVTVKPVHALVAQIMAGVGEPQLLVEGSASPHTFTLKPSAARAIEQADIFIRVSESTEPFTHRIVEGLPKSVALVTLALGRERKTEHVRDRLEEVFHGHSRDVDSIGIQSKGKP